MGGIMGEASMGAVPSAWFHGKACIAMDFAAIPGKAIPRGSAGASRPVFAGRGGYAGVARAGAAIRRGFDYDEA
jgi:hypothetical protein